MSDGRAPKVENELKKTMIDNPYKALDDNNPARSNSNNANNENLMRTKTRSPPKRAQTPLDEVSYMLAHREEFLLPEERALFLREDPSSEEHNIASELLCNRSKDLRFLKIFQFHQYMNNEKILDDCAQILYNRMVRENEHLRMKEDSHSKRIGVTELKDLFRTVDKYLFIMFRNGEITMDQLKARLAEKN